MSLFDPVPKRVAAWVAVFAAGCLVASATAQNASSTPGLLPGETYVPTANNCGTIVDYPFDAHGPIARASILKSIWTGQCVNGLASGVGTFAHPEFAVGGANSEYVAGRSIGKTVVSQPGLIFSTWGLGLRGVSASNIDASLKPKWEGSGFTYGSTANGTVRTTSVNPQHAGCMTTVQNFFHTPVAGCTADNDYQVYFVGISTRTYVNDAVQDTQNRAALCPNVRSGRGCDEVFRKEVLAIVDFPAFLAEIAAREVQLRRDAPALMAAWVAGEPARQVERQRVAAQQAAAAAAAAGEAAARADAAAKAAAAESARQVAARAKAESDFQTKLKTANAGELFALADELKQSGQSDQSRQALRSLVSRFPDSPLAPVAAQQMSGTQPSSVASSKPSGPAPRYSSACIRNFKKLEDVMFKENRAHSFGSVDTGVAEVDDMVVQIMQPCAAYDPAAARHVSERIADAAKIRQFCAGPHQAYECTRYGPQGRDEENRRYLDWFSGEISKARSDPNYSADLGSAATTDNSGTVSSMPSAGCSRTPDAELEEYNKEVASIRAGHPMPTNGARATYQWMYAFSDESLTKLEPHKACLGPNYQANLNALNAAKSSSKSGCDALAAQSGDCPLEYPK